MSTIIKILRSLVKGKRPTGRSEGEVWVNEADKQFGFIDSTGAAQDLLAVRPFSATSDYAVGDHVMQAGKLYRATKAITASAFTATDWDVLPADDKYLPLTGGTLTGALGIEAANTPNNKFFIGGPTKANAAGNHFSEIIAPAISKETHGNFGSVLSNPSTEAAAFTLHEAGHFSARGIRLGAGSAIDFEYGLRVSEMVSAANAFGAYITTGSVAGKNNWNLYADGTAPNFMAGALGIRATDLAGHNIRVQRPLTGASNSSSIANEFAVRSDVTATAWAFYSSVSTQAAPFTLNVLGHYAAVGGAVGAGSTISNQYGFLAADSLTQATNNFGFRGDLDSAANRWNFYANGTAPNAYAGNSSFGALKVPTETIDATGNIAATGSVLSSGKANGVGYKTGAGGTITQPITRTAGVTLHAVCGSIVLAPAAGLATYQTFTVTNSAVHATDVVHISQKSGTDKYIISVTRVAAGAFDVTFATTGGTTTEQPEFSFAIIRAVAA